MLIRHGYGVLAFDARGHGESDRETLAVGWGAYPDAAAAAHYLDARADVQPGRLGFIGLSMGAEIAIESAGHYDDFAAIVADGASGRTFEDARDASSPSVASSLGLGWMFLLDVAITALSGERAAPSLTSLSPLVTEPVLYIAAGNAQAERDLVTRIAERSGGEYQLWVIDGAGHTAGLATSPASTRSASSGSSTAYSSRIAPPISPVRHSTR